MDKLIYFIISFLIGILIYYLIKDYCSCKVVEGQSTYIDNTICENDDCLIKCNNINNIRDNLIDVYNNQDGVNITIPMIFKELSIAQRKCLNNIDSINLYVIKPYNINLYINEKVNNHEIIVNNVTELLNLMLLNVRDIYLNDLEFFNIYVYKCDPTLETGLSNVDSRLNQYNYISQNISNYLLNLTQSPNAPDDLPLHFYDTNIPFDNIILGVGGPMLFPILYVCDSDIIYNEDYKDQHEQTFIHEFSHLFVENIVRSETPNIYNKIKNIYDNQYFPNICNEFPQTYACSIGEFIAMLTLTWFSSTPLSNLDRDLSNNYTASVFHKNWYDKYYNSNINNINDIRSYNGLYELLEQIWGEYIPNNYCNNISESIKKTKICDPCLLYTDKFQMIKPIKPTTITYDECVNTSN